jgi:molybdopterin converting factor subunit 1
MRVRVKLFADLRELVGANELELELAAAATIDDAWSALVQRQPLLAARRSNLATAVNRLYVRWEERLHEGDELVFVPPVSGG